MPKRVTGAASSTSSSKRRNGLNIKLLGFGIFLLIIPALSYQYIWELEKYLKLGQEQIVSGTARTVASVLHERPQLFAPDSMFSSDVQLGRDITSVELAYPVTLDGDLTDWQEQSEQFLQYGADSLLRQNQAYEFDSLFFRHLLAETSNSYFAAFEVTDDTVLFRPKESLRIDRNDFLQIALITPDGQFKRYLIAPYEPGWVNAYLLADEDETFTPISLETKIQGQWRLTSSGYNIELRIPKDMVANRIAFAVADTDDDYSRQLKYLMGTTDTTQVDELGNIVRRSPELEAIIKGLDYSQTRIWIVDNQQRVLATSGTIQNADGIYAGMSDSDDAERTWLQTLLDWMSPFFDAILSQPPEFFIDDLSNAFALEGQHISSALQGLPEIEWRQSKADDVVILSAAHPIYVNEQVLGAVVTEQTTNGIRTLRNQALQQQFIFTLAMLLIGVLSLWFVVRGLTSRIKKLKKDTESAIDNSGKIIQPIPNTEKQDEIGDLTRSFIQVMDKLGQYNGYLVNMSSRLSHELRTPIAIVKSSLENIELNPQKTNEFLPRAQKGIQRLQSILNNMSEATRLEQTISTTSPERFDLAEVVNGCFEGFKMMHPQTQISLDIQVQQKGLTQLSGSPELIAQMLDKLIGNAVEFSDNSSPIRIRLFENKQQLSLSISNPGALLPEQMRDELFDSMISVRENISASSAHLGLGLYIAKMIAQFHNASISIENLPDHSGVVVLVRF